MSRRELRFENWEAVRQDIQALRAGYTQHGHWDLEQTAKHLRDWLTFPLDGFPPAPWLVRLMMGAMRNTIGKPMLRQMIASEKMKDGLPTAPQTVYSSSDQNDAGQTAAGELLEAVDRFEQHQGNIVPSPLYGAMDKATAEQLQFVHLAHHLSWLTPAS